MRFPSVTPCQRASVQALDIYRHFKSFALKSSGQDGVNLSLNYAEIIQKSKCE